MLIPPTVVHELRRLMPPKRPYHAAQLSRRQQQAQSSVVVSAGIDKARPPRAKRTAAPAKNSITMWPCETNPCPHRGGLRLAARYDRVLSQKAHFIALQDQTGKSTRRVRASVNIYTVRPNIRFYRRRMSVYHNLAEVILVEEKVIPNPEQIPLRLLLQRDARSHTRVYEEEVSAGKR